MIPLMFLTIPTQSTVVDPNGFNNYLILAYIAIWLVAMIYLAIMANRERNAKQELALMKQLLEEDSRKDTQ